jgi:hypothetical protein
MHRSKAANRALPNRRLPVVSTGFALRTLSDSAPSGRHFHTAEGMHMSKILAVLVAAVFAMGSVSIFAAESMQKDEVKKEQKASKKKAAKKKASKSSKSQAKQSGSAGMTK